MRSPLFAAKARTACKSVLLMHLGEGEGEVGLRGGARRARAEFASTGVGSLTSDDGRHIFSPSAMRIATEELGRPKLGPEADVPLLGNFASW